MVDTGTARGGWSSTSNLRRPEPAVQAGGQGRLDGAGRLGQPSAPMRAVLLLLALLGPATARAHDADIVFAQVNRVADGEVTVRLTLTAATLMMLAPVDVDGDGALHGAELSARQAAIEAGVWDQVPLGAVATAGAQPCSRTESFARAEQTFVALHARFECPPGELQQQFRILSVLPSGYKVVLGSYGQGELRGQSFAQGHQQTLLIGAEGAAAEGAGRGVGTWFLLGVEHIFAGIDHLAFVLALILVGGHWKRVLLLVTSFTLAHSITLGATALELIRLSGEASRWVEVAIAATIIWVALENLLLREHRHRVLLTFGFGLVHGFGFAGVLLDLGLGQDAVPALLGFNLGVEAGQAAVVLAAYPLVRLLAKRPPVYLWTLRMGSGAILCAGAFWMVSRLMP
jgi:hypothetical protein